MASEEEEKIQESNRQEERGVSRRQGRPTMFAAGLSSKMDCQRTKN